MDTFLFFPLYCIGLFIYIVVIIVRNKPLWLASLEPDLANEALLPMKVNNELVKRNIIKHSKLPRIVLYDSPSHAISALGPGLVGKTIYIYKPRRIPADSLVRPDIEESPLRDILGEYWSLTGIMLQLVETVVIDRLSKVITHIYYNPRAVQWKEHIWAYHRLDINARKTGKVYYIGKNNSGENITLMPGTLLVKERPVRDGYKPIEKVLVGDDMRLKEKAKFIRIK